MCALKKVTLMWISALNQGTISSHSNLILINCHLVGINILTLYWTKMMGEVKQYKLKVTQLASERNSIWT